MSIASMSHVTISKPLDEDRHPRTGGFICDLCATHQPNVIVARSDRMVLRICHSCIKSMIAGIIDAAGGGA